MLSTSSIFHEIRADDAAFRFFVSVAAKGENQGGWENERIAALTRDPVLRKKIARHGEDEKKHGRLFLSLLKKRGLAPTDVPFSADYCMQLEAQGVGLPHTRLGAPRTLEIDEILRYLAHSRVTEQRAAEEVDAMARVFRDDDEIGSAVKMIAADEANHLAYCQEELLRFADLGHRRAIRSMLRQYALTEIRTYRVISAAFIRQMAELLEWSAAKSRLLLLGISCNYLIERLFTWRRMVTLAPPNHPNPMG